MQMNIEGALRDDLDHSRDGLRDDVLPRLVFLFSGHMIDSADRAEARFPPAKEAIAATAIAAKLDELGMDERDLAICGGACGGDLLFAEAALKRSCRVELYLQFDEDRFLRASVAFAGQSWVNRYHAVKANPLTQIRLQPAELGPLPQGANAYVRNNLWQLDTALAHGVDKLRCIVLWNGESTTSPGGTENMVEKVMQQGGRVSIVDTRKLFSL